jgi:hypothetical protein
VIENNNNPTSIDLSKLPWEQDTRHFSAFIFVISALDNKKNYELVRTWLPRWQGSLTSLRKKKSSRSEDNTQSLKPRNLSSEPI